MHFSAPLFFSLHATFLSKYALQAELKLIRNYFRDYQERSIKLTRCVQRAFQAVVLTNKITGYTTHLANIALTSSSGRQGKSAGTIICLHRYQKQQKADEAIFPIPGHVVQTLIVAHFGRTISIFSNGKRVMMRTTHCEARYLVTCEILNEQRGPRGFLSLHEYVFDALFREPRYGSLFTYMLTSALTMTTTKKAR